ncbi:unnamed protein product [Urochloa decumbens]|uniref:Uncharacterized protein n=1 Tax=Urochloa decumbens TaxID=240449 RepID=A0ABC9DTP5_9POAL
MDHRWVPGALGDRPRNAQAGVARSEAIREAERQLESFAALAIQLDARVRLEADQVRQASSRQFRVPFHEVGASRVFAATFLIRFDSQLQRDAAIQCKELTIGHLKLQIMAWKCQFSSTSLTRFFYRARLCIEGVPSHAHHAEAVAGLFKAPGFFDDADCDAERPEEEECLRLWYWTADPDAIPTTGSLHIEEPVTLPQEDYAESLFELGMPMGAMRADAEEALEYHVIIHVDRVLDFSAPPRGSSHRSPDSPISGHLDEVPEEMWPISHPFHWRLGVPDDERQNGGERRRGSVHDRLGGRGRDRSPPRGGAGGAGNLGLRQVPPLGPHDLRGRFRGNSGSTFYHGSSSGHGGGHPGRRLMPEAGGLNGSEADLGSSDAGDSFQLSESLGQARGAVDPMLEEANWCVMPNAQQCSMEPTVAEGAQSMPERPALTDVVHQNKLAQEEALGKDKEAAQGYLKNGVDRSLEDEVQVALGEINGSSPLKMQADPPLVPMRKDTVSDPATDGSSVNKESEQQQQGLVDDLAKYVGLASQAHGMDGGGPLFDLNLACGPDDEEVAIVDNPKADRLILGVADERLNKEVKDRAGQKTQSWGLARLIIPLRKSLLCQPPAKPRGTTTKKQNHATITGADQADPGALKAVLKDQPQRTVDEKATHLLLKASGIFQQGDILTDEVQQQFGEKFVTPIQTELLTDMRGALGMALDGGSGCLDVLINEAEEC